MSTDFRPASPADIPAILAHQRDFYAAEGYAFDEAVARHAIEGLSSDSERGHLWVLSIETSVMGYLAVTFGWSLEFGGRDAFVDEVYVAPAHRGAGWGGRMIG